MSTTTEQTLSLWQDHSPSAPDTALTESLRTDICIVGAGIAGLTTAYLLAREGRGVVVLDQAAPGEGETGRTTAHLASAIDDRYSSLVSRLGRDCAKLAGESHRAAISFIEQLSQAERIECGFKRLDGFLFAGEGRRAADLQAEFEAARAAEQAVEWADPPPALAQLGRGLRFPNQGQFSPLDYLRGLRAAAERHGARIYGHTHVLAVKDGDLATIETDRDCIVRARHVVIAANTPFNDRVTMHTKLFPYQTYAIAATVPAGTVPPALYWDDLDPYHYVRLAAATPGFETLIIGGEDHKTGQQPHPNLAFENLERWARRHFPELGTVTHQWSGEVLETLDGLAYIGRNPGSGTDTWIATGDSGMGMTHGTIAGMLLSDLILGRENPWADIYDPARKAGPGFGEFAKENLNVARQYLDWATLDPNAEKGAGTLRPGQGAVFQRGLHKIAIHRDANGTLHERSAVCPHLGCIVDWNETEHTWDCPCHGSRFRGDGEVLHGPSPVNLSAVPPA
jgi:glycine/D-amino acid oxidase-like deaminating enzyme/nitrite reductase/ring-hydroxylating ferredoxin subunit